MRSNSKKKLRTLFILCFLLYFSIGLTKGCLNNKKVMVNYEELKEKYREEEEKNKELKIKLAQVTTDRFIEIAARKKLGLVKPGEVLFKIVEE